MKRTMILWTTFALTFAVGCGGDEAENAASPAATTVEKGASEMMNHAGDAANSMADSAKVAMDDTKTAAAGMAGDAVAACRSFAERGAWGQALEVCRKAHEMMPDDLALEHAYQQAQAAAAN